MGNAASETISTHPIDDSEQALEEALKSAPVGFDLPLRETRKLGGLFMARDMDQDIVQPIRSESLFLAWKCIRDRTELQTGMVAAKQKKALVEMKQLTQDVQQLEAELSIQAKGLAAGYQDLRVSSSLIPMVQHACDLVNSCEDVIKKVELLLPHEGM